MKRWRFVCSLAAIPAAARGAAAETVSPAEAIARLFTAPTIDAAWFSSLFLATYSVDQERAIVADILGALGGYKGLVPNGNGYTVSFERGSVQATARLNQDGAFIFLIFSRMQSSLAAGRMAAVFTTTPIPEDWFSRGVLTSMGIVEIRGIVSTLETKFGTFQGAAPVPDGTYDLSFSKGHVTGLIFIGADGKIESLNFRVGDT